MSIRHLLGHFIQTWRNLVAYFAWPEPKPTLKRQPMKRSSLGIDALENRTTPTILWGTGDFLSAGSALPICEPITEVNPAQYRTLQTAQAEIARPLEFSAIQVAQVDRILDFSPGSKNAFAPTPLPVRENSLPARDALFAQMSEEPAMPSGSFGLPTMKHRAAPHPAMIGAMALVAVPLLMTDRSRDESSPRADGPRKPFPRTIRL